MRQITNCPLCQNSLFKPFISCFDNMVSRETFHVVECVSCGLKFTNPVPNPERLNDYYKSETYISHTNTKEGLIAKIYHLVRNYTLKKKLLLVSKYVSRGTLLDYGCGTGMFLEVCKNKGWNVLGIEPSEQALRAVKEKGLKVFSSIENIKSENGPEKFDVITLWHVLEHIMELRETIDFFSKKLNDNGVLIIAVPNHKSYDAEFYKEFWAAYDAPRHLYHFEKKTIVSLLSLFNFRLSEILPMKFDSFYVSLLSEKYRSGRNRYLNAIYRGFVSNRTGRSSGEYSSLIYVFKKEIRG